MDIAELSEYILKKKGTHDVDIEILAEEFYSQKEKRQNAFEKDIIKYAKGIDIAQLVICVEDNFEPSKNSMDDRYNTFQIALTDTIEAVISPGSVQLQARFDNRTLEVGTYHAIEIIALYNKLSAQSKEWENKPKDDLPF